MLPYTLSESHLNLVLVAASPQHFITMCSLGASGQGASRGKRTELILKYL